MSPLGFPNQGELLSMMGFVTNDDRAKWDSQKAASDKALSGNGKTAGGLASKATAPAFGLAEKAMTAKLHAASTEEQRDTRAKRTRTVITETTPLSVDETEMGY